jgi:hypothetical protein
MYQQRVAAAKSSFRRRPEPWTPRLEDAAGRSLRLRPRPGDRYVVVDEIVEGFVRLVVEDWPSTDRGDRLHFAGPGEVVPRAYRTDRLRAAVDKHRRRHHQLSRDLRVGDVFLVRAFSPDPRRWGDLWDVTQPARVRARLAHLRTVGTAPRPPRRRGAIPAGRAVAAARAPSEARREAPMRPGSVAHPVI